MEIICLDTSVLVEYYRSKDKSKSFWFALSMKYQFNIPAVVKYEILRGDKKKDKFWINIFEYISILPFDTECGEIASEIYQLLKGKNQLVGSDDIMIAATAKKNKLKIATVNSEHFYRIEGIKIISPKDLNL